MGGQQRSAGMMAMLVLVISLLAVTGLACSGPDPQKLYTNLLSTPFPDSRVPRGFTARSSAAGNLDATAKAFRAIGQVNIVLGTNDPRPVVFPGVAGISYTVFPTVSDAKGAYDTVKAQPGGSPFSGADLPYPATVLTQQTFGTLRAWAVLVDNVLVATVEQVAPGGGPIDPALAKAAVAHLKEVQQR